MRTPSLLLSICLLSTGPLFLACGDKDGGDGTTGADGGVGDGGTTDGGTTDGGTTDGGTTDGGTSDGGTTGLDYGDVIPVNISPMTLPLVEGGDFILTVRTTRDITLESAVIDSDDLGEISLELVSQVDDLMTFSGSVRAAEGGGAIAGIVVGVLLLNASPVADVPIRRYRDSAELAPGLDPASSSNRYAGLGEQPRSVSIRGDDDEDSMMGMDLVTSNDGDSTFTVSRLDDDDGVVASIEVDSPLLSSGRALEHRGHVTVLKAAGGGGSIVTLKADDAMEAWSIDLDETDPTATQLSLAPDVVPDVVLDVLPIEIDDVGTLDLGVLGLVQSDRGLWSVMWYDGLKTYSPASIGDATADGIIAGTQFAGLALTGSVQAAGSPGNVTVWSFDPGGGKAPCEGRLTLGEEGVRATALRSVALYGGADDVDPEACATFSQPHAVGATVVDVDNDGNAEIVMRVYGEDSSGAPTEDIFFVPNALDPDARTSAVKLQPEVSGNLYVEGWSFEPNAETSAWLGNFAGQGSLVLPSTTWVGGTVEASSSQQASGCVDDGLNTWSVESLLSAAAESERGQSELDASTGGIFSRATSSGAVCRDRGVCQMGTCFCVPGYGGQLLVLGDGDGPDSSTDDLMPGELVYFGGVGSPVASRVHDASSVGSDLLVGAAGTGADRMRAVIVGGGSVIFTDTTSISLSDSTVSVDFIIGSGGSPTPVVLYSWASVLDGPPPPDALLDRGLAFIDPDVGATDSTGLTLPPEAAVGGTSAPIFMGEVSDGGGVHIFWRDGTGQAWVATVDVPTAIATSSGELPLLAGPTAIGTASLDIVDDLMLSDERPGAVGTSRTIPDTPFLSIEDLEERFESWDEPLVVPFGDDADTATATLWLTVPMDGGDCPYATVAFPDSSIGDDSWADTAIIMNSELADCSDLAVPLTAGAFVPDSAEAVLMAVGDEVRFDVIPDGLMHYTGPAMENPIFMAPADASHNILAMASSGDADGDGIDDVVIRGWGKAGNMLLSSNGDGTLRLSVSDNQLDGVRRFASPSVGRPADVDEDADAPGAVFTATDLRR